MGTRPAGQRNRAQPVWRKELDSEGGRLAGTSAFRPCRNVTAETSNQTESTENMSKQTQAIANDLGTLAEDARALMTATADVAGDKVGEARERLAAALDSAKEIAGRVRDKAVEGAKAADQAVRDKPYQAIGIAFAVGAVVAYFVMRRCSRNGD